MSVNKQSLLAALRSYSEGTILRKSPGAMVQDGQVVLFVQQLVVLPIETRLGVHAHHVPAECHAWSTSSRSLLIIAEEAVRDSDCPNFQLYGGDGHYTFPAEIDPTRVDIWALITSGDRRKAQKSVTGYKGVQPRPSGKYVPSVSVYRAGRYVGTFDTPEEAALAYNKAALELLGPDAILNAV